MNSTASKELKLEIYKLEKNYTREFLDTKTDIQKIEIQNKLKTINETIKNVSLDKVYCPDTGELLKKKSKTSPYYETISTCGHCSVCLKAFHYTRLAGSTEKGSWPVCFVGKGVVCKNCMEK